METVNIGDVVRVDMTETDDADDIHRRRVGRVVVRAENNKDWLVSFGVGTEEKRVYPASVLQPLRKGDLVQVSTGSDVWNTFIFDKVEKSFPSTDSYPVLYFALATLESRVEWTLHFKDWWRCLRHLAPPKKPASVVVEDPPYGGGAVQVDSQERELYALKDLAMMLFVTEPLVLAFAQRVSEGALPLSEKWTKTIRQMWRRNEGGWRKIVEDRALQMDVVRGELEKLPAPKE